MIENNYLTTNNNYNLIKHNPEVLAVFNECRYTPTLPSIEINGFSRITEYLESEVKMPFMLEHRAFKLSLRCPVHNGQDRLVFC